MVSFRNQSNIDNSIWNFITENVKITMWTFLFSGLKVLTDLYENTNAYRKINARLIETPFPGCENEIWKTDAYYECHIRHFTTTYKQISSIFVFDCFRDTYILCLYEL